VTAIRWPFRLAADSLGRELKKLLSAPHLAQGQRARESAVPRDILRSKIAELGHNGLQKGLAFGCDWSGTVVRLGCQGRSEILPRRLVRRRGASVVRRDAVMSRMEDLNVKICQEAIICKIITCKIAVVSEGGEALSTVC